MDNKTGELHIFNCCLKFWQKKELIENSVIVIPAIFGV